MNVTLTKEERLQRKLRTAMKYARDVCVIGATNRLEDVTRTNGWSYAQQYRYDYSGKYVRASDAPDEREKMFLCNLEYDPEKQTCYNKNTTWFYRVDDVAQGRFSDTPIMLYKLGKHDPIFDTHFDLFDTARAIIFSSMRAEATRSGNCGTQARLVSKYLWENHEGVDRIEIMSMDTFDHAFVVVNRGGEINQPETWGDAWVIDPWAMGGLIYPAKDFSQKITVIKNYVNEEITEFFKLGIVRLPGIYHAGVEMHSVADLRPAIDKYPRYHSYQRANDFYAYNDNRFTAEIDAANQFAKVIKGRHELRFDDCLEEIKAIKTNPVWCKLFQEKNKKTRNTDDNREQKRSRRK